MLGWLRTRQRAQHTGDAAAADVCFVVSVQIDEADRGIVRVSAPAGRARASHGSDVRASKNDARTSTNLAPLLILRTGDFLAVSRRQSEAISWRWTAILSVISIA